MSEQIDNELPVAVSEAIAEIPSVGAALRAAREAKGLPIADIARALKLGQRQVEALEQDEWSGLPGTTFIRGFVRNYARMVDLDATPLMLSLDALLKKPVDTLKVSDTEPAPMSTSSSRDGLVVGVGAAMLVLAALGYFLLPNDLGALRSSIQRLIDGDVAVQPLTPQAVLEPAQPSQEGLFPPGVTANQLIAPQLPGAVSAAEPVIPPSQEVLSVVQPAKSPETVLNPPQLRFVAMQESWVEIRDRDGTVVFSQRLASGAEQVVSGKGPLSVVIGFAPGIRLFSRGKTIDLAPHTKGDVARLVLE
jgi:cytoskeleton protein RodZ